MKITLNLALLALTHTLLFSSVLAQAPREITNVSSLVEEEYDPISSLLDSLVTITNVVRYNQLDVNCFDPNTIIPGEIPQFSTEVYEQRMASIHSPIPLSYNAHVKGFIDMYAVKKRGLTQRVMGLSNLYFPIFEEALDREGLPLEFKYLSIVESALNPIAVSRVGATGIWQFMYNTGLQYNLKVNSYTDERRDPIKSTQAACQYFKDMYSIYGDWLLVIAAYNCGAGNVNKAIKRSGGKTNFWDIMNYLPNETKNYVPAFIAITYVMEHAREHNLYPVSPAYSYFEVDTVIVNQPINFRTLAATLDLPLDVISYLNPIYKRGLIPDVGGNYVLRLPTNKMAIYMLSQESIYAASLPAARPVMNSYKNRASQVDEEGDEVATYDTQTKRVKKTHTVRRGESLGRIASKYDMTVAQVKKMNKLRSSTVRSGQRLTVYNWVKTKVPVKKVANDELTAKKEDSHKIDTVQKSEVDEQAEVLNDTQKVSNETAEVKNTPKPAFKYYIVQPGDTLWNIAKRYEGLTVEMIKDINNLSNTNIKPGTKLKVLVNG
ncbi:MAG: LysM peptidoglycan-binding domain-containing protein [Bacteroidia bacterium]